MTPYARVQSKDFLSMLDFEPAELEACLAIAARVKRDRALDRKAPTKRSRHVPETSLATTSRELCF